MAADMFPIFSTADLHDAQPDEVDVVNLQFRSFGRQRRFHGPVETLRVFSDHSAVREVMKTAGAGRVLVVDSGGDLGTGVLGDQIGANAVRNGWAGVIVNGAVRDSAALDGMPIGVRALGTTARRSSVERVGQQGVTVKIGGVCIAPSDWLYADADAVLVAKRRLDLPEA